MGHGEEVAEQLNPASPMDSLPDDLLVQILSFLPTKQAVSTSVLAKRWRVLFASTHNFAFESYFFCHPRNNKRYKYETSEVMRKRFNDFVDRTLSFQIQGGKNIKKFSLELCKYYKVDEGDKIHISRVPPDTYLPALKVLILDSMWFEDSEFSDVFLPACPALEDLTIQGYTSSRKFPFVISNKTIKKLSVSYSCDDDDDDDFSIKFLFDTPNVVDFYYLSYLGAKSPSPQCRMDSLAKAKLNLCFLEDYKGEVVNGADMQSGTDVTDLISGIRNVKTLHLTSSSVEVITACCKGGLPVFNNLVDLVFSSKEQGWKSLFPRLLRLSPNLKTLVLSGLDCFPCKRHRFIWIPRNNQINMLRIMKYQGYKSELKHLSHFLMKLECLEVLQVYVAASMDGPKKKQLKEYLLELPTASSNLKIQVM